MTPRDERHELKDPEKIKVLNDLAARINKLLPEGFGFTLFMFSYGPDGELYYISSAERATMVETIEEWLRKQADA